MPAALKHYQNDKRYIVRCDYQEKPMAYAG
jgi:hypothetical protein